jgi:hypothetical protein
MSDNENDENNERQNENLNIVEKKKVDLKRKVGYEIGSKLIVQVLYVK